ncbi:MAG: TonB-dependent receptor [Cyclobacteriaceae bacterium]|nr:TonB-dependent receptor [Cyclobacteriaceae bacterium]MCH8515791.1 TonB-dependent receptor [Cyclobacteriaceae bacterium]
MKRNLLLSVLLLLFAVGSAWAQERTVRGTVTDPDSGEGMPGVNVVLKGTSTGVITNLDGVYNISVSGDNPVLVFSFTGMLTSELPVGNRSVIDITMVPDIKQLSEVVVMGYGTQERREITGSVSSVAAKDIQDLVTPSFDQQLAGRAAGVQVTTPGGVIGQRPIIRIRGVNSISGSSSPLIVIDNVPIVDSDRSAVANSNPLANINPADIESFEILKDGSATAIFGSRAANGVILITTKRGSEGKARINYSSQVGINETFQRLDMMNAEQWVPVVNERFARAGVAPRAFLDPDNPVDTDWQDLIFRTGNTQQHNLSISGGSEATKYFFSLGYTKQEGVLEANDLSRYSFRSNIDHKISRSVRLGTSLNYTFQEINALNNGENSLSGAILNATRQLPNVSPFDPNNLAFDGWNVTPDGASTGLGPNSVGPDNNIPNIGFVLDNNFFRNQIHRILGNAYLEADLLPGLTARTQVGVDLTASDDFQSLDGRHGDGRSVNGSFFMSFAPAYLWNVQNTLNYQASLADVHNFNVTVGTEYQYALFRNFSGSGNDLSDNFFRQNNIISGAYENQFSGGGFAERGFDSYFGRVNYNYDGRYLVTASLRNDGISDLSPENRRGWFWGGSLGWRISEEAFFPTGGLVSDLKVRGSYAEVGNTEIGTFAAFGGFNPVIGGAGAGIGFSAIANGGLLWETSKKTNIGFDIAVGQVTFSADYFQNNVDGLVLNAPTAPSLGVPGNNINLNVGSMFNEGLEFVLSANLINRGKFSWTTDFNLTLIRNEVTNLVQDIVGTYNRTTEGGPIAQLYGVEWMGVNPANGNPLYKRDDDIVQWNTTAGMTPGWRIFDENNPSDISQVAPGGPTQDFLGNTLPTWFGGFINRFNYGNWDAEVFLRFSGGNFIMNETQRGLLGQGFANNHVEMLDRWTAEGQVTNVPAGRAGQDANIWQGGTSNSRFVEKGDFLRVQDIRVGYSIPSNVINNAFNGAISNVKFIAQVQNPFLFTNYSGLDPELNRFAGQLNFGVDWNVAPIIRTYSLGINVGF